MPKGINMAFKEFESAIANVINNSGLPICLVRLELEQLLVEINRLEAEAVNTEVDEFMKEVDKDEETVS